jgi:SnoaL-like domain
LSESPEPPPSSAEDRDAIRSLLTSYGRYWDCGRVAEVAALFTADGEWRSKHGAATGPAEIEALLEGIAAGRGASAAPVRRHFVANLQIDIEGPVAQCESDFIVVQAAGAAFSIVSMGTYRDKLVRHGRQWKFCRREIVHPDLG